MGWDMNMVMKVSKSYPSPLRLKDYLTWYLFIINSVDLVSVISLELSVNTKSMSYLS